MLAWFEKLMPSRYWTFMKGRLGSALKEEKRS
jgi:hypothetical protein